MKNYPYNTGRTVTINLDTLGNAAIWQLFQIVTAGTNNIFEGDEPDADPAADSNAATEIFLHIAETADERADGADAAQRDFLLGTKEDYLDIFGDDGPANVTLPGDADDAPEEAAPIKAEEILREEDPEYRTWDDALIWLDGDRAGWNVVEEAARIASLPTYKTNLHAAGRAYGMAEALAIAARIEGANADWWLGFIEDFSADNYDNGARIEE